VALTETLSERDKLNVSLILTQQVLDLFKESGTTAKEQNVALDIIRRFVLDRLYDPKPNDVELS
jgi:hypothetical protein